MEQELTGIQTAVQSLIDTAIEFSVNYSFQVIGAIIILIVGGMIANSVYNVLVAMLKKKGVDITLTKFTATAIKVTVLSFAFIIALGKFGITIAPFIAALGAMAFGASFALQGPLANFGAGIAIILSRPFVVGNTIRVAEVSGVVQEVKLGCTILKDEDGVIITIPNKKIVGEILHNSAENKIYEGVVGVSYKGNPRDAIKAVRKVIDAHEDVCKDPKPQIGIEAFGDSSINIAYRIWIPTVKFFHLSHAINLEIYDALQSASVEIPFPQRDLHIISQPQNA